MPAWEKVRRTRVRTNAEVKRGAVQHGGAGKSNATI